MSGSLDVKDPVDPLWPSEWLDRLKEFKRKVEKRSIIWNDLTPREFAYHLAVESPASDEKTSWQATLVGRLAIAMLVPFGLIHPQPGTSVWKQSKQTAKKKKKNPYNFWENKKRGNSAHASRLREEVLLRAFLPDSYHIKFLMVPTDDRTRIPYEHHIPVLRDILRSWVPVISKLLDSDGSDIREAFGELIGKTQEAAFQQLYSGNKPPEKRFPGWFPALRMGEEVIQIEDSKKLTYPGNDASVFTPLVNFEVRRDPDDKPIDTRTIHVTAKEPAEVILLHYTSIVTAPFGSFPKSALVWTYLMNAAVRSYVEWSSKNPNTRHVDPVYITKTFRLPDPDVERNQASAAPPAIQWIDGPALKPELTLQTAPAKKPAQPPVSIDPVGGQAAVSAEPPGWTQSVFNLIGFGTKPNNPNPEPEIKKNVPLQAAVPPVQQPTGTTSSTTQTGMSSSTTQTGSSTTETGMSSWYSALPQADNPTDEPKQEQTVAETKRTRAAHPADTELRQKIESEMNALHTATQLYAGLASEIYGPETKLRKDLENFLALQLQFQNAKQRLQKYRSLLPSPQPDVDGVLQSSIQVQSLVEQSLMGLALMLQDLGVQVPSATPADTASAEQKQFFRASRLDPETSFRTINLGPGNPGLRLRPYEPLPPLQAKLRPEIHIPTEPTETEEELDAILKTLTFEDFHDLGEKEKETLLVKALELDFDLGGWSEKYDVALRRSILPGLLGWKEKPYPSLDNSNKFKTAQGSREGWWLYRFLNRMAESKKGCKVISQLGLAVTRWLNLHEEHALTMAVTGVLNEAAQTLNKAAKTLEQGIEGILSKNFALLFGQTVRCLLSTRNIRELDCQTRAGGNTKLYQVLLNAAISSLGIELIFTEDYETLASVKDKQKFNTGITNGRYFAVLAFVAKFDRALHVTYSQLVIAGHTLEQERRSAAPILD